MKHIQKKKCIQDILLILVSILITSLFVLWGTAEYETNDDQVINLIASGAYSFSNSAYLIYQNIIYGWLLKLFYLIYPDLNWYFFLMIFWNHLAITSLAVLTNHRSTLLKAFLYLIGASALLGPEFYNSLQYTKNASLLACIGFIWILLSNRSKRCNVIGVFFLVLAWLIRWQAVIMVFLFFLLVVLIDRAHSIHRSIGYFKGDIKANIIKFLKANGFYVSVIFVLIACFTINYAAYHLDERWSSYSAFNKIRTDLTDYGDFSYELSPDEYNEIGIDANDVLMLTSGNVGDSDIFPISRLEGLNRVKNESNQTTVKQLLTSAVRNFAFNFDEYIIPKVFLLICLLCFILRKSRLGAMSVCFMAFIFVMDLAMIHSGRIKWRAEIGMWVASILFIYADMLRNDWFNRTSDENHCVKVYYALCGAALWGVLFSLMAHSLYVNYTDVKKNSYFNLPSMNQQSLFSYVESHPDNFYFSDNPTLTSGYFQTPKCWVDNKLTDIRASTYRDFYRNFSNLGDWPSRSPVGTWSMEQHDISNAYGALLNRPDTYLVAYDIPADTILRYIRKYYDADATIVKVDEANGIGIWRFEK